MTILCKQNLLIVNLATFNLASNLPGAFDTHIFLNKSSAWDKVFNIL